MSNKYKKKISSRIMPIFLKYPLKTYIKIGELLGMSFIPILVIAITKSFGLTNIPIPSPFLIAYMISIGFVVYMIFNKKEETFKKQGWVKTTWPDIVPVLIMNWKKREDASSLKITRSKVEYVSWWMKKLHGQSTKGYKIELVEDDMDD